MGLYAAVLPLSVLPASTGRRRFEPRSRAGRSNTGGRTARDASVHPLAAGYRRPTGSVGMSSTFGDTTRYVRTATRPIPTFLNIRLM